MEAIMNNEDLKFKLIESLEKIYYMEAFSQMADFLQGELYILRFLFLNKDEIIGPSELSNRLHMSRPRVTATIAALKKKGFVITKADEIDRRRLRINISKKGLEFIKDKQESVENNFEEFVTGIGEKDTLELIRIIDLAVDIMGDKDKK